MLKCSLSFMLIINLMLLNKQFINLVFQHSYLSITGAQREEKFPSCVGEGREFYFEMSVHFSHVPNFIWEF